MTQRDLGSLTIWTIGHSTRTIEEFIALLAKNCIDLLADNIAAAWEKITDQIGRDKQVALYKASLGM